MLRLTLCVLILFCKECISVVIRAAKWKLISLSLWRGYWWGDFVLNGEDKSFCRRWMERGRLNRPCVIPDYTGTEMKAVLRDLLHSSVTITLTVLL